MSEEPNPYDKTKISAIAAAAGGLLYALSSFLGGEVPDDCADVAPAVELIEAVVESKTEAKAEAVPGADDEPKP